jgi:hypothetical protein
VARAKSSVRSLHVFALIGNNPPTPPFFMKSVHMPKNTLDEQPVSFDKRFSTGEASKRLLFFSQLK